jgi:hypothetical protein
MQKEKPWLSHGLFYFPQAASSYRLRQFEQSRDGLKVASIEDDGSRRGGRSGPGDRHGMRHLAKSPVTNHHRKS